METVITVAFSAALFRQSASKQFYAINRVRRAKENNDHPLLTRTLANDRDYKMQCSVAATDKSTRAPEATRLDVSKIHVGSANRFLNFVLAPVAVRLRHFSFNEFR